MAMAAETTTAWHNLTFRLIVSLVLGITVISISFSILEDAPVKRSMRENLDRREEVIADSLAENAESTLTKGSEQHLQRMVTYFGNRSHL
jgi:hypothetical protein